MTASEWITVLFIAVGAFFFLAGSVGVLRFPDVFTRLHALTKADNLGLGLVIVGVALQTESWALVLKLGLIWLLVILSSATVCCLIADTVLRRDRALLASLKGDKPA
jgi:multicomponent Na+:H+ antiporter subunit G